MNDVEGYSGWAEDDDFCLEHGYEHMRKRSIFDKVAYCAECERLREREVKVWGEIREHIKANACAAPAEINDDVPF